MHIILCIRKCTCIHTYTTDEHDFSQCLESGKDGSPSSWLAGLRTNMIYRLFKHHTEAGLHAFPCVYFALCITLPGDSPSLEVPAVSLEMIKTIVEAYARAGTARNCILSLSGCAHGSLSFSLSLSLPPPHLSLSLSQYTFHMHTLN